MNYTTELATFAANTTFSDIPSGFVALLSLYVLDTFAAMLAGSVQPVYQSAVKTIEMTHGSGSMGATYSALDGTTSSLSGQMFLMGLSTSDFEYEHNILGAQPASSVLPALLCVAASHNKTGQDFLTALAVGYELATRIAAATTLDVEKVRGFHAAGLASPATAAAVGNLLGWDTDTIASAMGIAASSSAGLLAYLTSDADTRSLHPARAGQLGAEAAFMAQAGILGPSDVLENPDGYLHAFSVHPEPHLLTSELGTEWTSKDMALKLAPCHVWAQGFVYAIDQYRQGNDTVWNGEDISNVTLFAGPSILDPMRWIAEPTSLRMAQYSIPFSVAAALTMDITRNPLWMNDSLVSNPTTRSIASAMQHVRISDDPEYMWGYMTMQMGGKLVNITADTYPGVPGSPGYGLSVEDKFGGVVRALGVESAAQSVKESILQLATVEEVSVLLGEMVELGKMGVVNVLRPS